MDVHCGMRVSATLTVVVGQGGGRGWPSCIRESSLGVEGGDSYT